VLAPPLLAAGGWVMGAGAAATAAGWRLGAGAAAGAAAGGWVLAQGACPGSWAGSSGVHAAASWRRCQIQASTRPARGGAHARWPPGQARREHRAGSQPSPRRHRCAQDPTEKPTIISCAQAPPSASLATPPAASAPSAAPARRSGAGGSTWRPAVTRTSRGLPASLPTLPRSRRRTRRQAARARALRVPACSGGVGGPATAGARLAPLACCCRRRRRRRLPCALASCAALGRLQAALPW
jgi:hypothetical protein